MKYYKIDEFDGKKRVQSELDWRWEYKDEEGKDIPGEHYRSELNEKYNGHTCRC